jgi:RNA polymerase sigma factor (sigma-70 family)
MNMNMGKSLTSVYLSRWNAGDEEGLEKLIEFHLPWLQNHVRKRVGPKLRKKAETNDFVHDAMLDFLRYGPKILITDPEHFRALLVRIVENSLRNRNDWYGARRRAVSRERPLPSDTALCLDPPQDAMQKTPSKVAARHEQEAWIRLGMELLEPEDQKILILRQWDQMSFTEIGREIGLNSDAARMRYNRAICRLSDCIWELRSGGWLQQNRTDESALKSQ